MTWKVLIIELETQDYADTWAEIFLPDDSLKNDFEFIYAANADDAKVLMTKGDVMCVVHIAIDQSYELTEMIRYFQAIMGPLPEHQIIICDEPSPQFMANVYEYGLEHFLMSSTAAEELKPVTAQILSVVNNPHSVEAKIIRYQAALRLGNQDMIISATKELGDLADWDYRVAYVKAKSAEYTGDLELAIETFRKATSLNFMFRPSQSSLGEDLLLTGQLDDALFIFEKLDRTNPNDIERKTQIASAYVEKNDLAVAQKYCDEIYKIDPESTKILEINAQICLSHGKLGEAFTMMDKMENVGPFFAAKLNDMGIKLSQSGRVKNALALYQKAHKIVRPELRYKISMNSALACRKMQDYDRAIKYALRCEKEYGSAFPKLVKIKQTLAEEMAQAKPVAAKQLPVNKAG